MITLIVPSIRSEDKSVNNFEDNEFWVYAKALKREGAEYDGQIVSVKEQDAIKCCKCRRLATPAYAKKYGVLTTQFIGKLEYFCEQCRSNIGKCFICKKYFESDKDLSQAHPTQVECKDCLAV
jgi:hypothetical protein